MTRPRIHLLAVAGACRPFFDATGFHRAADFLAHVQHLVGDAYDVSADEALLDASEDERDGGRRDDARRAADIEAALADDRVAALVSVRGGAWFTRVLPRIDFKIIERRARPVAVLGFSELTTLVNIVAAREQALGIYDTGPGFLPYGMRRYAALHHHVHDSDAAREPHGMGRGAAADRWMRDNIRAELERWARALVRLIETGDPPRPITARLARGRVPETFTMTCVGGTLVVWTTLLASPYLADIAPAGKWLVLEEINEKLERVDRFLAALTLAGVWEECAGLLLGDFHRGRESQGEAVLRLLDDHVPRDRELPVLVTEDIGHVWPAAVLPLNHPMPARKIGVEDRFEIDNRFPAVRPPDSRAD
jgi:muramoyltetrapeptide carboxypeptidase LdcA involved in peptidoglycan recycling